MTISAHRVEVPDTLIHIDADDFIYCLQFIICHFVCSRRQERRRKPDKPDDFVTYEDSDSEEETPQQQNEILNTSYSFVDFVRSREINMPEQRSVKSAYASSHLLTHDMMKVRTITIHQG